jgi:hypothetical protein
MRPDGAPEDFDQEQAARDYYDRKARHRDEMLRPLSWVFAIGLILAALMLFFSTRSDAQEIPVPLEAPCPSGECTIYNQAFVFALTGDERMIRWSLDPNDVANMALFTEITVFEFPPKAAAFPVMKAELPEVDRSIGWTPNRAGTYFVEARACRTDGDLASEPEAEQHPSRGLILCSIIASSTDPAATAPDVYPRGFVLLIKLAPATGGGIE